MTFETESSLDQIRAIRKGLKKAIDSEDAHDKQRREVEFATSTEIRTYNSCDQLKLFLNEESKRVKALLEECFMQRQEIRDRAERVRRIFSKLAGVEMAMPKPEMHEVDVYGLKLVVCPDPEYELELFNFAVRSLEQKLLALENIQKACAPLSSLEEGLGVTLTVALTDGIPTQLILNL